MKKRIPRALRKVLTACLAALCLAAFLAPVALAAEPKRTPIALGKTVSVSLSTPPVAAHGPTYSFTAPASGIFQLKVTDVLQKKNSEFRIEALDPKNNVLGSCFFSSYDWGGGGDASIVFAAKKGAVVILDLIASMDLWDEKDNWIPTPPNTQVATFKMQLSQMKAAALALDKAAAVKLTEKDPAALFSFTPAKDGYYSFASSGSDNDPCAALYDGDGKLMDENDDAMIALSVRGPGGRLEERDSIFQRGLDFNISEPLKAGKTYYLLAKDITGGAGEYTLTVSPSALSFASDSISIAYHKSAWFSDLLDVCTYDTLVLSADFDFGWLGSAVEGYDRGSQVIQIASPDGKVAVDVTFKVDYSFAQWFAAIFVGGWLWLPRTPVLMPGQTILGYWRDQIVMNLYDLRWELEYRLDQLNPLYWF